MPTRAFIAHDRVVTAARMYFRMAMIGLLLAAVIYGGGMYIFYSYYLASPVPEIKGGMLVFTDESKKLPAWSIVKYYISPNLQNYINLSINRRGKVYVPQEIVEPALRPLLGYAEKVPREIYQRAVFIATNGRVEILRRLFPVSLLFFPVFGIGYLLLFSWINKRTEKTEFVRGADLIPFNRMKEQLEQAVAKENTRNPLRLGEVELSDSVSRLHMLILGTSGTGKSVCLNRFIKSLKGQGTSVVYDVKGEFCGKHYTEDEKDIIFYPFDKRSVRWCFFNEIRDYPDFDILATSLYEPPDDKKDAYWYNAARDVFRTGITYLYKQNKTTNADIWDFFSKPVSAMLAELTEWGEKGNRGELGALKHIQNPENNTASSIISIVQERLTFFRYLREEEDEDAGTFSFRDFISSENGGNLFLMNIQQYESIFRPLMTFVIDIMIREVLSLTDSRKRRITFVIDEFGSLSKMASIFGFLTMGRSKGGFLVLANQDLGSVANVYGNDRKETFYNNFNIHLTFRLNDPTTSEFLARGFGKREVIKKYRSSSFSPSDVGDRFSLGEQEKVEEIVLPTEFQNLPNFHSYLKIANYGVTRMETKRDFLPDVSPEFIPRDFRLKRTAKPKQTENPQQGGKDVN